MNNKRRIMTWMLVTLMVISVFNVPFVSLDVQAEENNITITWETEGEYIYAPIDDYGNYGEVSSYSNIYSQSLIPPSTVERENYIHKGWMIEGGDGTLFVSDGSISDGTRNIYEYVPTTNTKFIAVWAETCTVTYDGNGGYYERYDAETGEYICDNPTYTEEREINTNMGSYYGAKREGYILKGYRIEGDDSFYSIYDIGEYKVTGDVKFIAEWVEACTVTYDGNGGYYERYDAETGEYIYDSPTYTEEKEINTNIGSYPTAKREGYVLKGYRIEGDDALYSSYTDEENNIKNIYEYKITGDVTFTAEWGKACTVTYDGNGGCFERFDSATNEYIYDSPTYTEEKEINTNNRSYPTAKREGYILKGYRIEGDDALYSSYTDEEKNTKNIYEYKITGDVTFKAEWVEACTVTYDGNGGYYERYDAETGKYIYDSPTYIRELEVNSDSWSYPTVKREGYILKGYRIEGDDALYSSYTDEANNIKSIYKYTVTGDVTFTAEWAEACKITILANGGTFSDGKDTAYFNVAIGEKIRGYNITYPQKKGYEVLAFKNIKTNEVYYKPSPYTSDLVPKGANYLDYFIPYEDTSFEVVWTPVCHIRCFPGEGYSEVNSSSITHYGYTISAPGVYSSGPTRGYIARKDGMKFSGWLCSQDGKIYQPGDKLTVYEDIDFIAQFEEAVVVHFSLDGGFWRRNTINNNWNELDYYADEFGKIALEEIYIFSSDNKKAFAGWKKEGDNSIYSVADINNMTFDQDTDFSPVWEEGYSVRFYSEEGYLWDRTSSSKEYAVKVPKDSILKKSCGCIPVYALYYNYWNGHYIEYWTIDGNDKKLYEADILDMVINGDITLTAHWGTTNRITFNANGGKILVGPGEYEQYQRYYNSGSVVGDMNVSAPDGYELVGWTVEDSSSLSGTVIKDLSSYVVIGDATFTAKWKYDCEKGGHRWNNGVVTVYSTCTKKGNKVYTCVECGVTKNEEIRAKGHTPVVDSAVAATATSTGLTLGTHCSVCGEIIVPQTVIPIQTNGDSSVDKPKENNNPSDSNVNPGNEGNANTIPKNITDQDSQNSSGSSEAASNATPEPAAQPQPQVPTYSSEWVDGKWYDAQGNQTYSGTLEWKANSSGWWIEDTDGWYPVSCWQKIDGFWYYFDSSGYMVTSAWQDGCWLGSNGAWTYEPTGLWKGDSSGWWFEDTSGWYPNSQWLKIYGSWYYFDSSGYMVTSKYIDGYWIGADGVCQ